MMLLRPSAGLWPARFRDRRGLRWLAIGGLAWIAAGAMLLAVLGRSEQLAVQRSANAAAHLQAASHQAASHLVETVQLTGAQRFRSEFPPMVERQRRLKALLADATRHGLRWQRVELRQTLDKNIGLARYEITLPLTGSYTAIRQTVDEALSEDAGLGLDRIQLRRPSAATSDVEATSVWSLWMADRADLATPSVATR